MGRKHKSNISGLIKRNEVWHIEKMVNGERIRESTGTGVLEEAEKYLIYRLEQIRLAKIYGETKKDF